MVLRGGASSCRQRRRDGSECPLRVDNGRHGLSTNVRFALESGHRIKDKAETADYPEAG